MTELMEKYLRATHARNVLMPCATQPTISKIGDWCMARNCGTDCCVLHLRHNLEPMSRLMEIKVCT